MIELEEAAAVLESSPDYKVLRRFWPRFNYNDECWNLGEPPETRLGVFVDVETTGLDRGEAEIIEFAAVPFVYDYRTGIIYEMHAPMSFFEQPSVPISDEIRETTGITDEMVRGQRLDDAAIIALVEQAQLVVAHNAEYDRPICEKRLPVFAEKHWACSQKEIDWPQFGCVGAKLENVLAGACGEFTDGAHRAAVDCQIGVHVLASARLGEHTALWYLLESARRPTVRITAKNAPFEKKEAIKTRRPKYRWCDGENGTKGWYVDVKPEEIGREIAWLRESVYRGEPIVEYTKFNSRHRYSSRVDQ